MAKKPGRKAAPAAVTAPEPADAPRMTREEFEAEAAAINEAARVAAETRAAEADAARVVAEAAQAAANAKDEALAARETIDAVKVLKEQAAALGLAVDPEWDVDELAAKVLEAQEAKAKAERAAFDASAKERVFLIRDCWPLDVRHYAGETIEVPRDIATRWYVTGAARPA